MKLTKQEEEELEELRNQSQSRTVPVMFRTKDRIMFLQRKMLHNSCNNHECVGFQGQIIEPSTECPHCGSELVLVFGSNEVPLRWEEWIRQFKELDHTWGKLPEPWRTLFQIQIENFKNDEVNKALGFHQSDPGNIPNYYQHFKG